VLLEVKGLVAGYGKHRVLDGVDLVVDSGEAVVLIGHNGAGKTTTLRAIFGQLRPQGGEVRFDGRNIADVGTAANVRAGIAYVPQGRNVFGTLSVLQNLHLGAFHVEGADRHQQIEQRRDKVFELFPILRERHRQTAGTLSGGQQQMLALGMALMTRPRIIMLDEPSNGLAPVLVQRVLESIQAINREFGTAVLLVEQNVRQGLRVTRRAYAMKRGRITYAGDCAELLERGHFWDLF
jgi:branched-chain amino acid transport system ATP-binding protein